MPRGKHTEGERAKAAAMLGSGASLTEIEDELGIGRTTLWRWRQDAEFQKQVDAVVTVGLREAGQQLRSLAPLAVEAFERGLRATHRQTTVKVEDSYEVVDLRDDSLAVRSADLVTRRIAELMPKAGVDVNVDASERVAELIRRLDARDDGADRGPAAAPAAERPDLRGDEPVDPDQA